MPSTAYTVHLVALLRDATALVETRSYLATTHPALPAGWAEWEAALNRATVVTCVSAWEGYVEAVVREAFDHTRPAGPGVRFWPVRRRAAADEAKRLHNPTAHNVRELVARTTGPDDVCAAWAWPGTTAGQAVTRLNAVLDLRRRLAHGVNPRPPVTTTYATDLPDFVRHLGRATDAALRATLAAAFGVPDPWPA